MPPPLPHLDYAPQQEGQEDRVACGPSCMVTQLGALLLGKAPWGREWKGQLTCAAAQKCGSWDHLGSY